MIEHIFQEKVGEVQKSLNKMQLPDLPDLTSGEVSEEILLPEFENWKLHQTKKPFLEKRPTIVLYQMLFRRHFLSFFQRAPKGDRIYKTLLDTVTADVAVYKEMAYQPHVIDLETEAGNIPSVSSQSTQRENWKYASFEIF